MRILLAEDNPPLAQGLRDAFGDAGYVTSHVGRGNEVLSALRCEAFDLLVLDLGLPGCDGLDVLKHLRAGHDLPEGRRDIPVLILTARDGPGDRVRGLDQGADDYLVKPFEVDELLARARALVRRAKGRSQAELRRGELCLHPDSWRVVWQKRDIALSRREFTLLRILAEGAGQVFSRNRLNEHIYDMDTEIESNSLEVHVHHLRRKLPGLPLETVRGVGYRLR